MAQFRVLVVDDSSFMRTMLKRMIEKDSRFEVIDTATNGQEGVEKTTKLRPDVVTMDVEMPVMSGLEALKAIMAGPRVPVVMVSALTDKGAQATLEALDLGAVDFLPKALSDRDNNVFKTSDILHEKLAAAASVKNFMDGRTPVPTKVVPPKMAPPQPAPTVATKRQLPIKAIIVGSSTGGPKALQVFVANLPATLGVPIFIAQHMPAHFTGALAKRLNECTPHNVIEAQHRMPIQPNYIYLAPGEQHMRVIGHAGAYSITIKPDAGESVFKPSVGVLAASVAEAYQNQVLGVMLTGMGNDGAQAFAAMHQAGAITLAQDQATSVVYGMPRAVAELNAATEILPLADIGGRIGKLLS